MTDLAAMTIRLSAAPPAKDSGPPISVNGVGDALHRRSTGPRYANDAFVFDDEANITEFAYAEDPADADEYVIAVAALAR